MQYWYKINRDQPGFQVVMPYLEALRFYDKKPHPAG
jgi:hypothetical protein